MTCPAGEQWPGELSWVPEVKIGAKRLYEACLLGESVLDRRHPWGRQIPAGSPWWPGYPVLALETPKHPVEGQRSNLHNGEARRKGVVRVAGRA